MNNSASSVSVGHGPGTPSNEGTAKDRGTSTPDSNLTEIDATQERAAKDSHGQGTPPIKKPATTSGSTPRT